MATEPKQLTVEELKRIKQRRAYLELSASERYIQDMSPDWVERDEYYNEDVDNLGAHIAWQEGEIARLEAELAAAGKRENALREALAFYADIANWAGAERIVDGRWTGLLDAKIDEDEGSIAQAALATPPSGVEGGVMSTETTARDVIELSAEDWEAFRGYAARVARGLGSLGVQDDRVQVWKRRAAYCEAQAGRRVRRKMVERHPWELTRLETNTAYWCNYSGSPSEAERRVADAAVRKLVEYIEKHGEWTCAGVADYSTHFGLPDELWMELRAVVGLGAEASRENERG